MAGGNTTILLLMVKKDSAPAAALLFDIVSLKIVCAHGYWAAKVCVCVQ